MRFIALLFFVVLFSCSQKGPKVEYKRTTWTITYTDGSQITVDRMRNHGKHTTVFRCMKGDSALEIPVCNVKLVVRNP